MMINNYVHQKKSAEHNNEIWLHVHLINEVCCVFAAFLRSLCSCRATDNQDHGSSGVERKTVMSANEERTHGNSHLITCLTCSNGRQCTHDQCVSNSKIAYVYGSVCVCVAHTFISLSFHQLCLFLLSLSMRAVLCAGGLIIFYMPHSFTVLQVCACVIELERMSCPSPINGDNRRQP